MSNYFDDADTEQKHEIIYSEGDEFVEFIESIPALRPIDMCAKLAECGYVGQERAQRSLALMAYRHIQRLRNIYLYNIPVQNLPAKSNYLLVGPTGCGKTFLIETLFRNILNLPTVLVDITAYSETGYVGQDVPSILTRLLYAANGNISRAEVGIACIDEFDKLATVQNNAVFAGAGTTKDISGLGVQRELLKLLESSYITIPVEFSPVSCHQYLTVSTANIPFVACGAFSGLKLFKSMLSGDAHIGFMAKPHLPNQPAIAVSYNQDEMDQTSNFHKYGFLPELIARFDRIVPFMALDRHTLTEILRRNLLAAYQQEFDMVNVKLDVDHSALDGIVQKAIKRETGARGLRSYLTYILEDAAFEVYSNPDIRHIHISYTDDQISVTSD